MSKSKPNKVFKCIHKGESVIVLARHIKGARTRAAEYLGAVPQKDHVIELPDSMKNKALNRKEAQA